MLTNAADGLSHFWLDGVVHILRAFARNGAPERKLASWNGRWWGLWGAIDLVPMGRKVMVATPGMFNPFLDASEVTVIDKDRAKITQAIGGGAHGQGVRRVRNKEGEVSEIWFAGTKLLPEAEAARRFASATRMAPRGRGFNLDGMKLRRRAALRLRSGFVERDCVGASAARLGSASRLPFDRFHIGIRKAEMMADLVDQHMA